MNTLRIFLPVLIAPLVTASAAVSPIHINVDQASGSEIAGNKPVTSKGGKAPARSNYDPMGERTQRRELKIKLHNNSTDSFSSLVVKYWFFGRDMKAKSHQADVLKSGERKASLGPRASETVESEVFITKYVEEHQKVDNRAGGSRGGRGGVPKATKVPASGQKVTGYAVRVYNGDQVVAEYYSEQSYKDKLNGGVK